MFVAYELREGLEMKKFTTFGRRFSLKKKMSLRRSFFLQNYLDMKSLEIKVLIADRALSLDSTKCLGISIYQGRQQLLESSLFWSHDDDEVDDIDSRLIVLSMIGLPIGCCGEIEGSGGRKLCGGIGLFLNMGIGWRIASCCCDMNGGCCCG